jgi:hypothetical protein
MDLGGVDVEVVASASSPAERASRPSVAAARAVVSRAMRARLCSPSRWSSAIARSTTAKSLPDRLDDAAESR